MRPTTITLTRRNAITVATLTLAARAACARRIRQMERQAERRMRPGTPPPSERQATRAAEAQMPLHSREAWRRGRALAARELPDLEARLRSEILCTPEDREALTPAILMRARGELWLCGYAALLWRRLVAAEPVEAYYGASGRANVWDGTLNQRLDARAWNLVSSDLWAAWADGEMAAEREV